MDKDIFTLNNKTYSNNNNILNGIINELQQIVNSSHEDLTIKRISDVIIKMNFIINENKKNHESIINQFTILQNKFDQLNQKMNINNINNQKELKGINDGHNWRYVGQVVNGLREGKGICYWDVGDRYEGDFRNDKAEGKGIYYWNIEPFKGDIYEGDCRNDKQEGKGIYYFKDGDIYEGDFKDGKQEGKGIIYYNDGDRYEGDYRNGKREGKGIYYYNNGDREMGDYYGDNQIGKHVMLKRNGEVKINNY